MGYTQIDNSYLDKPNGLENAEFRVLMCILRLTSGFHRNKYKIKYVELTEMSGVQHLTRVVPILKQKGFIDFEEATGTSYTIRIKPINSVKGLPKKVINSVNDTHSVSEPHPLTQFNGSRGSKKNFKENFKESTLSNELIEEMKSKYPDKDIDQAQKSFLIYPHHQGKNWSAVVWAEKFKKWCASEKPSNKKFIAQFKLDGGGANYVGYCAECSISDFYAENELMGDSRCCNAKILPNKPL